MSDGAMMSHPASACTKRLLHEDFKRLVIGDVFVIGVHHAVMAVTGVGIERHIAEHADLWHMLLDRAHRAADEIVGVDRFAPVRCLQAGIGIGK